MKGCPKREHMHLKGKKLQSNHPGIPHDPLLKAEKKAKADAKAAKKAAKAKAKQMAKK